MKLTLTSTRTSLTVFGAIFAMIGSSRVLAANNVLYDQTSTPGGILGSQEFLDAEIYSCTAADDFVVPAGATWTVTGVRVLARYEPPNSGPASSFNVTIFSDAGTFPGSPVCDHQDLAFTTDGSSFTIDFPAACVLTEGTYWLAVQANSFLSLGTWVWVGSLTTLNSGCVWENPLDGFGSGATTFERISDFSPGNSPDLSFQILGPNCTDLGISQSATQKTVKGSLNETYTLKVKNFGPAGADAVTVSDFLPPETTFASASASQGTISAPPVGSNGTVVCNLGSIPNGQTATITITAVINVRGKKSILNTATLQTSSCDTNPDNNHSTLSVSVNGPNK